MSDAGYTIKLGKCQGDWTLKQMREMQGYTQLRVAKKMGINIQGVSRLERSQRMRVASLQAYVEAIEMTLELWLVDKQTEQAKQIV